MAALAVDERETGCKGVAVKVVELRVAVKVAELRVVVVTLAAAATALVMVREVGQATVDATVQEMVEV